MKKVYMLMADYYHTDDVLRPGMETALGQGYEYLNDPDLFPWNSLCEDASGVVIAKSDDFSTDLDHPRYNELFAPIADWMTEERSAALERYIKSGGGALFIHSGLLWREDSPMARLVGGYFIDHPQLQPIINVPFADHPVTRGVQNFTAADELYECRIYSDTVTPLCASYTSKPSGKPTVLSGWCREHGAGRIVALTPGHTLESITNPNMTRMIQNSIEWIQSR